MAETFDPASDDPMIRRKASGDERDQHVFGYSCPFCGAEAVKVSYADIPQDRGRIELYCDNPHCAVREFTILAMFVGETRMRSDVQALSLIDERPIDRQRREEYERTGEMKFHAAVPTNPREVLARRTGGVRLKVDESAK